MEGASRADVALRELARGLAAAHDVQGVLHRTAELALLAAGAEASYLERIDFERDEVEVVATAGAAAPAVGARVPYPGSLAQEVVEQDAPELVTSEELARRPIGRILSRSACADCIALVFPLISEGEPLGALILIRRPEHSDLGPDEITRLRALADIAALAFRRTLHLAEVERNARALEESERRFRLLVESVEDYAIFMLDPDGHVVTWNRGAQRIKGYSEEEVLGKHFSIFYTEEDQKRGWPAKALNMAARTGRFTDDERWRVRKDGSRFRASVTLTAIRDQEERLLGFAKVTRDLTERWQAEEALRESEERFRQLAESAREVFWLFDRDFAQPLYVSPAFEAIWGRPIESLYHDPASWLEVVHPEDRDRVLAFVETLKKREASLEYRVVHPNGEARWVWVRGFPIRNGRGEIYRIGGVTDDVTERKEAEERQRFLAEASRVLASSLDYYETLRSVASLAVPRVADWCVVDVLEGGEIRRLAVAHAEPAKEAFVRELVRRYPPDPDAPTGVAQVLRTGEPQLLPEIPETQLRVVARDEEHLRILRELGLRSAMIVPLVARGRTLGAISFVVAESGRRFGPDDLVFAQELAGRAALAVDNARLYAEAEAARQRATGILESITDAFYAVDREWRFTYVNRHAEPVVRRSSEELLGKNIWEEFPEAVGSTFHREYHRAIAEQIATHFEEFFPPFDAWFEVHAYPSPEGLSVFFRDVTERKRAEEALRLLAEAGATLARSLDYPQTFEAVARLAVTSLADFCLIDIVEDGELRRLAAAHRDPTKGELMQRARRYPPGPGSPLTRPLQTAEPVLIPELTQRDIAAMARNEEHRRQIEATGIRSLIAAPLIARGHTLGVITFAAAESGRKYRPQDLAIVEELASRAASAIDNARLYRAAEEARAEAERRAREEAALRQAAHAVTATFSIEEVIRQVAESSLAATGADGAFVKRIDLERNEVEVVAAAGEITPDLGARTPYPGSFTQLVIEGREPVLVPTLAEAAHSLPDGIMRSCGACSAMIVPLLDGGEAIGTLALVRRPERQGFRPDELQRARTFADLAALAFRKIHLLDDSERRREELERVMESRARLIRGFSHDVKNPLGAADGFLHLIEAGIITDPEKQELSIVRARRALRSALGLIDDLVELARAEAGQIELTFEPVDVREVARDMTEEYRAQAEAKGLAVDYHLPDELPVIESDAARVRQILGNLISNAVKYTPQGRVEVTVAVRAGDGHAGADQWVAVGVSDTGAGIPAERQHLVFQEFTRLDPKASPGAGLGLAISQRVAEALGGRITVRSEIGRGSTFTLWLPLRRTGGREATASSVVA